MFMATILAIQFTIMMLIFSIISISTKDIKRASLFGWFGISFGFLLALMATVIIIIRHF